MERSDQRRIDGPGAASHCAARVAVFGRSHCTNQAWRSEQVPPGSFSTPVQENSPVAAPQRTPPISKPEIESRANGFPNQRIPASDGHWTGEVGNSGWVSSKPEVRAVTNGEPVPFKDGYPDFSKWKVAEVEIPTVTGLDDVDRTAANKIFAKQQSWLKSNGEPNAAAAERYRKANQLTWHHVENSNRLQLIPKGLKGKVPHTGSSSQARNGELP